MELIRQKCPCARNIVGSEYCLVFFMYKRVLILKCVGGHVRFELTHEHINT